MTLHFGSSTETAEGNAQALAVLREFAATRPAPVATEAYDGPTPEVEFHSPSEADRAADLYYGDAR